MENFDRNKVPIFQIPIRNERIEILRKKFRENFNEDPGFFVRVPGRVNLIGEHIDYCGYGVLPMALQKDILVAVSKSSSKKITLINTNEKYEKKILFNDFSTDQMGTEWYDYFCCGIRGAQENFPGDLKLEGMNIGVDGNIPPSAGLSSSSALVSAAALCTFYVHGIVPIKNEIADLCARAERYIGTQGGGMDQAIAFLASEGCAQFIEFNPLRTTEIKLPNNAIFVISHSLVEKNKAASNDFNCRVVECRLAAQVIAKKNNLDWKSIKKLKDVQDILSSQSIDDILENLHDHPYTKIELIDIFETNMKDFEQISMTCNTKCVENFKLKQRALHVLKEFERVKQFKKICEEKSGENALVEMGRLMYASHESLKNLYEASHPQLDRIVEISRKFAYGCRLTGAGWGGCAVALVATDKVNDYIDTLKREYYARLDIVESDMDSFLFSSIPSLGACIYQ